MVVSNRNLLFQGSIFRCYVSFREGDQLRNPLLLTPWVPSPNRRIQATFQRDDAATAARALRAWLRWVGKGEMYTPRKMKVSGWRLPNIHERTMGSKQRITQLKKASLYIYIYTSLKINGWNLKITQLKSGKVTEPNESFSDFQVNLPGCILYMFHLTDIWCTYIKM